MNLVLMAKKRLPYPMKVVLRPLYWNIYRRWNLRLVLERQLVRDIMEYFNLRRDEAIMMLRLGCRLNALFLADGSPTDRGGN